MTMEYFQQYVNLYRERYAHHGHGRPEDAIVGAGGGVFVRPNSQDALTEYAPYFYGNPINQGADLEHAVANTGLTVGSPQQVIDKVLRFPKYFGRTSRILFGLDFAGIPENTVHEQLDLLGEQVLPVLRRELGDA